MGLPDWLMIVLCPLRVGFFVSEADMRSVVLLRDPSSDQGTLGRVFVDSRLFCRSIELPARDNKTNISCILPAGTYRCVWHKSPKYGWCYMVTGVPGRSLILIHAANWAGDRALGYRSDLRGCIALGMRSGRLAGQLAVLASKQAVSKFNRAMNRQPFDLIILEAS